MIHRVLCAAYFAAAVPMTASAGEPATRLVLSNALSQDRVVACFADKEASGCSHVNVFVGDHGGHLLAASRPDGACKACASIAHNKAIASAVYGAPTRMLADLSFAENRDSRDAGLPGAAVVPGLSAFAGGLPFATVDGALLDGTGVKSASRDGDEQRARASVDTFPASLIEVCP